jgi:hypothetical protein
MERPVKLSLSLKELFAFVFLSGEADRAKVETAITTVDHSDIRGSSLAARHHGRDPSGAASDWERESGRRACRIGFHEDSPFRVPHRLLPALLHHNHYYGSCLGHLFLLTGAAFLFYFNPDSPDKSQKLPGDSSNYFLLNLPFCRQLNISLM